MPDNPEIRRAELRDVESLADLWFTGWQDGHAGIVPAELARLRTRGSFRERLEAALDTVRVADLPEGTGGFSMIKADELYQFYVAEHARGSGLSIALMNDVFETFGRAGVRSAWLACAIGNDRAARFYEKTGWTRVGVMTSHLPTPAGIFDLDVWRYEIRL